MVVMVLLLVATFNLSKFPGFGGTTYTAEFSDASGIHRGNMVQVGGIRVGRVTKVSLDGDKVIVEFEVDNGVEFGKESKASVEVLNLLGEKYLELTPAGEGQQAEDTPIPRERTESAYDIVGVFGDLTTTTEQIDKEQLVDALGVVSDTVEQSAPEIQASFDGIARLSETVASRDEQIKGLLESSKNVSTLLADRSKDIVDLMQQQRPRLQGGREPQAGHPPAAGQRPHARGRAARGRHRQPGADRAGAQGDRRADQPADQQGEGAQGHAQRPRALRQHPVQHHRYRPLVRRVRRQPRVAPDR